MERSVVEAGLKANALDAKKIALPVFFFLVAVVLPFSFAFGSIVMSGVRLVLIALVVPMTIRLFTGSYGKVYITDILFFVHILWAAIALGINNPDRVVQNIGSTGIEFIGGYLLGRAYVRSASDMAVMLKFFIMIIVCTLPFAVVETLTGHPVILETLRKIPLMRVAATTYDEVRLGLDRVQLAFITPIHYGLFSMLGLSFCFVGLRFAYSGKKIYLMSLAIVSCVFLSLSSGALLPLVLQLFVIFWDIFFRKIKKRWLVLFGFFLVVYIVIDLLSTRSPYRVFMQYATFSPGTAYWRAAIAEYGMNNVWANPVFGIGLNDWERPLWMASSSVDNFWLLMAMRYGIIGFLTVASGYAIALWRVGRADLGNDPILLNLQKAWVFSFSCLTLTLYTVHIWSEIYSLVFFLLGSGMWMLSWTPNNLTVKAEASQRVGSRVLPKSELPNIRSTQGHTVDLGTQDSSHRGGSTYTRFPLKNKKKHNEEPLK